ncbi:MAG: hypothetical protein NUV77_11945 [Thermoguttaceae bacterium]|nr:hypothetical protein [Thermoguttaceae bacterium]
MAAEPTVIPGIVRNGVVVPQSETPLPDGARVGIVLEPAQLTPQLQAELAQWEAASDEAWSMIDRWEQP